MNEIKKLTQALDHLFNIVGYIPLLSTLSGAVRIGIYSVVQGGIAFVCLTGALLIGLCYHYTNQRDGRDKFVGYARFWASQILEGRLNAGRGTVELVPFIGNALCYGYDKMMAGRELGGCDQDSPPRTPLA